ncbi:hypothetical protein [Allokutzneria sp. NRRL B-24872]|uniref:hypothetical protein n=1 Tax=Allokutzneria sp. NRRL B-24872 TaxID=1137961 RepID=UPI001178CD48|nr:hypothetical protein [Allokutzneria sp. NRRL B-24872]
MLKRLWWKAVVGRHAPQWTTVAPEKTVLAVVHNVTAATRLLDVLPLVADDHRVRVVWTCTGSSPFSPGTEEWLREHGMDVIPWRQALRTRFDAAISASYGGKLHAIKAPLVVVPHGMGYNKYSPGNRKSEIGNRKSVFGLSVRWLFRWGRLIPSLIVLSHHEQLDRLRAASPTAADIAVVAGDPCFDRMLAGLPLRETYRAAFGAAPGQRLVLISSTWGKDSLYGQNPDLPRLLAHGLPQDEYKFVIALHPNVWTAHQSWQVERWLARSGVALVPPEDGWRAAAIAADLVIGDHGSVPFYAAALGTPLLLATKQHDQVDPASPVGLLNAAAPLLDLDRDLLEQVAPIPRTITDLTTSIPGDSAKLLRTAIYAIMNLGEPATPAEHRAVPIPTVTTRKEAQLVRATLTDSTVDITRWTAELLRDNAAPPDTHLLSGTDESKHNWLELAEVLVHEQVGAPESWIETTLKALPGCLIAAMPTTSGWLIGDRDGNRARCVGEDGRAIASALYAWTMTGRPWSDLPSPLTVNTGPISSLWTVEPG